MLLIPFTLLWKLAWRDQLSQCIHAFHQNLLLKIQITVVLLNWDGCKKECNPTHHMMAGVLPIGILPSPMPFWPWITLVIALPHPCAMLIDAALFSLLKLLFSNVMHDVINSTSFRFCLHGSHYFQGTPCYLSHCINLPFQANHPFFTFAPMRTIPVTTASVVLTAGFNPKGATLQNTGIASLQQYSYRITYRRLQLQHFLHFEREYYHF